MNRRSSYHTCGTVQYLLCLGLSYHIYPSQLKESQRAGVLSMIMNSNKVRILFSFFIATSGHLKGLLRNIEIRNSSAGKMMRATASS